MNQMNEQQQAFHLVMAMAEDNSPRQTADILLWALFSLFTWSRTAPQADLVEVYNNLKYKIAVQQRELAPLFARLDKLDWDGLRSKQVLQ
jgi:hypothetical protein